MPSPRPRSPYCVHNVRTTSPRARATRTCGRSPRAHHSACSVRSDTAQAVGPSPHIEHACTHRAPLTAPRSSPRGAACRVCGGARPRSGNCPVHGRSAQPSHGQHTAKVTVYPESLYSSTRSVASSGASLDVRSTMRTLGATADHRHNAPQVNRALHSRTPAASQTTRAHALRPRSAGWPREQNLSPNSTGDLLTPVLQKAQQRERESLRASLRRLAHPRGARTSRSSSPLMATGLCTSQSGKRVQTAKRTRASAAAAERASRSRSTPRGVSGGYVLDSSPVEYRSKRTPQPRRASRSKSPMRRHSGTTRALWPDSSQLHARLPVPRVAERTLSPKPARQPLRARSADREQREADMLCSAPHQPLAHAGHVAQPYRCVAGQLAALAAELEKTSSPQAALRPASSDARSGGGAGGLARPQPGVRVPPAAKFTSESGDSATQPGAQAVTQQVVAECLGSAVQDLCRRLQVCFSCLRCARCGARP